MESVSLPSKEVDDDFGEDPVDAPAATAAKPPVASKRADVDTSRARPDPKGGSPFAE